MLAQEQAGAAGEAPPQDAPRSRAGAGEAGPAGAAAPGQGGEEHPPPQTPRGLQEANPYRSLGAPSSGGALCASSSISFILVTSCMLCWHQFLTSLSSGRVSSHHVSHTHVCHHMSHISASHVQVSQ